jgi:hypothetical protein
MSKFISGKMLLNLRNYFDEMGAEQLTKSLVGSSTVKESMKIPAFRE